MDKIRPLKRFGQNYLQDKNILTKIVDEIDPKPGDNIMEIGPGQGSLTEKLLEKVPEITAVEIDKRVADDLKEKFRGLNLIRDDFLKIDLHKYATIEKKLRVSGNIPYNLTSSIIFHLIEHKDVVKDAVLMVQHEVAKRMQGKKGTKDYGILAVILQYFTEVNYCFKVSPKVFYPRPKVDSAVVHLKFRELKSPKNVNNTFIRMVKACFGNRRKTLKNSLSNGIFKEINFADSGIDLSLRAEQLEPGDFITLAEFALKKLSN
jgi:16S rRNA (adenine1518-N6/adenine1519-N6)-dimethyltransferase